MTRTSTFCATSTFAAALCLSLSTTAAIAAGAHESGHGDATIGKPGDPASVGRTIEVMMGDIYFEPEAIKIVRGETVRFIVKNDGELVHEFNIGTPEMHAAHQQEMMMMMEHGVLEADKINRERMKMDMGNGQTMEHDDPNSLLLEPGESAEVVWTFTEPATLEFACNVPGHYDSGMAGSFEFVQQLTSD